MPAITVLTEFRRDWLPHVSDDGLERLVRLLADQSPFLIHGTFARCQSLGCLATHIAWHHPRTRHLHNEAGITWLTRVARLNPALSKVILAWDAHGLSDWELRHALLAECRSEQQRRADCYDDSNCEEREAAAVG